MSRSRVLFILFMIAFGVIALYGPRFMFILFMVAMGFVAYNYMVAVHGPLWMLTPIALSLVAMLVIRYVMEYGNPAGAFILNPATQSWAFLIGDTIFIPIALICANYAWSSHPSETEWFNSRWWYWVPLACGYALAAFWNLVLDGPNYQNAGLGDLLLSPSHLWHGWVAFPVLAATLINYGVPVIIKWWRRKWGIAFIVALLGYALTNVADATIHPLNPANLHPPVSQTSLAD